MSKVLQRATRTIVRWLLPCTLSLLTIGFPTPTLSSAAIASSITANTQTAKAEWGRSVTWSATVSRQGRTPIGEVIFSENSTAFGKCTLSNGKCSINVNALSIGLHNISVRYSGNTNVTESSTSFSQIITSVPTQVQVRQGTATSSVDFQAVLNIKVTAKYGVPTGKVAVVDSGMEIEKCTLAKGACVVSHTYLYSKIHTVKIYYLGDKHFDSSISVFTFSTEKITPKLEVKSLPNPAYLFQTTVWTMTVSNPMTTETDSSVPTGLVSLEAYGTTPIGACTLISGSCQIKVNASTLGHIMVKATYLGDAQYSPTDSTVYQDNLDLQSTVIKVSPNQSPILSGTKFHFDVDVTSPSITATGVILFEEGEVTLGQCVLKFGSCSSSDLVLSSGSHAIKVEYSGDEMHKALITDFVQEVQNSVINSPLSLAIDSNPVIAGSKRSAIAYIFDPNNPVSGKFTFSLDGKDIGNCQTTSSSCSVEMSAGASGTHSLFAQYLGDSLHSPASQTLTFTTLPLAPDAFPLEIGSVSADVNTTESINLPILLSGYNGSGEEIVVKSNGAPIANCTLSKGSCSVALAPLSAGSHLIQAFFTGNSLMNSASGSTVIFVKKTAAKAAFATNNQVSKWLELVTLTTTFPPDATGVAIFEDGGVTIGGCQLIDGSCSIKRTFRTRGLHNLILEYSGDEKYLSSSLEWDQTVSLPTAPTSLKSNSAKYIYGDLALFEVSVMNSAADGRALLRDGESTVASCVISKGSCVIPVSKLSVATHKFIAEFLGNDRYSGSLSSPTYIEVSPAQPKVEISAAGNLVKTQSSVELKMALVDFSGSATGYIEISDISSSKKTLLGYCILKDNKCSLKLPKASIAKQMKVLAEFSGSSDYLPSKSEVLVVRT